MTIKFTITGKVQGVGYRYFVQQKATALGLTGWVKNNSNGSVSCVASGDEQALESLRQQCLAGPSSAVVQLITMHVIKDKAFADFVIKRN